MPVNNINRAWKFDCVLEDGKKLNSWFYADTEQDAKQRITKYMGAKLVSIKEIDDPLETRKREVESEKTREVLAKKRLKEHDEYLKQKEQNDSN